MAADGSVIIDTKIDDSGVPKQLGKLKTSLATAAKTLALPIGIAAAGIAAVSKIVGYMSELNKIYMVQASAERALASAAENNPYLSGESVQNLKRFAGELQKVSNYGDEVTIGLMAQLAAAGRTEAEIQRIIKVSADLAASGTTTFDGAVKNLNKTYSGLSGELGEVIPELKTLTAEQMKNGEAVDLIAEKYDGMAASVVDKSVQIQNALGDMKEEIGKIGASTGLTDIFQNSLLSITEWYTSGIAMFNDWVSRMRGTKEYSIDVLKQTRDERIALMLEERKKVKEINDKLNETTDTNTRNYLTQAFEMRMTELNRIQDGITMLNEEIAQKEKELAEANKKTIITTGEEITEAEKKQIEGRIAAQEQYEAAVNLATEKQKGGLITLEEKWELIKRAAEAYTDALIILGYTYDEIGTKGGQALDEMRRKLTGTDLSAGLGVNISGVKLPMGIFDTFVNNAADLGDDWGKQLTSSMSSALDNTSVGVSESIGGIVSNIGAAITIAVGIVKKIFAGIKAVARFDPTAMYESFLEIIDGLTKLFEKIGSLPIYIDAGKEVLYEFAKGLLENRKTNAETMYNVLKYMLDTAIEVIPAVISLALLILTDFANAVIMNLPLIVQTALEIVNALVLGVLEALPTLLSTLISIIPMILTTLISGVPLLIVGIIGALPEIITAVINALTNSALEIMLAFIEALIFSYVLYQPILILALLGALVELFMSLGKGSEDGGKAIQDGIIRGLEKNWNTFINNIKKMAELIAQPFIDMGKAIGGVFEDIGKAIGGAFDTTKSSTSSGLSEIVDWIKGLFNAEGTNNFRGGTAIINEEGAEMVTLPSGSKIMTASATAQMQDRAISQLLAGMKTPTFAVAGSGGSRNINISTKVDAPINVDGAMLGRLVFQNIDRAVI